MTDQQPPRPPQPQPQPPQPPQPSTPAPPPPPYGSRPPATQPYPAVSPRPGAPAYPGSGQPGGPGQQGPGQPGGPAQQGPSQPWGPPPPHGYVGQGGPGGQPGRTRQPGRRRGLGAGVVTLALLLGVGGGVGGAAAYQKAFSDSLANVSADDLDTSQLDALQLVSVNSVAKKTLPSVVKIDARDGEGGGGSGSGIVISADGEILTNNHVAELGDTEDGSLTVSFDDGTQAKAEIVGLDPATDTALIKAEGVDDLDAIDIASSDAVEVGQAVVAVGSPYGLQATVTAGIVSALHRPVVIPNGEDRSIYGAIQTDAAINPGNSGGALVNMLGQLVGINSAIETARGSNGPGDNGSIGIGYAIPIDDAMPIVEQMRAGEEPTHARLGVAPRDEFDDDQVATGAEVADVTEGSAAEAAGIQEGDVITSIGGIHVASANGVAAAVYSFRPGEKAEVVLQRDGEEQTVEVTMGSDGD